MPPKMTTGTSLGNWKFSVNLATTQTSSISWERVNIVVRCSFPIFPARFFFWNGTFHVKISKDNNLKNVPHFFKSQFQSECLVPFINCAEVWYLFGGRSWGWIFGLWCSSPFLLKGTHGCCTLPSLLIQKFPQLQLLRKIGGAFSTRKREVHWLFLIAYLFPSKPKTLILWMLNPRMPIITCNVKALVMVRIE